ncbi:hypothetical protein NE615_27975, partial [Escherichia coli]|nr:hypothetical protein [Escherichia coli]
IQRGQVPPNLTELLMSERFAELVKWASKNYDLVLIDTPPILAVTDAAIVGRHVGTTLMVARYAVNTLKEVDALMLCYFMIPKKNQRYANNQRWFYP